ncbi:MAG TPA: hypothetical protein VLH94_03055 [Spirochaetia bacterium]|nr:hypothetical protein [Spirochaetia bacterium]
MPEIFGANKVADVHEVVELEKSGKFKSLFGSFVVTPPKTRFESQDNDEKIVILGRKHFVVNLKWMALACFAFFVPMFWGEFPMVKALDTNTSFILSVIWYSALLFYVIQNFVLWFYNVYIVTNERLVDVDFFGLMYKNINVTQIEKLQDVNYSQRGIFSSFFNYGDVVVQTSSEQRSDDRSERSAFTFNAVANPDLVVKIISELMEEVSKQNSR